MNRRLKIIVPLTVIVICFILYYVSFLAPYNLNGIFKANSFGIMNISSFKEIGELSEYFKDYSVSNVKYLGNNSYEVFTDKGDFIVIADYSDSMYWRYKIFKYDKQLQHFTNPM